MKQLPKYSELKFVIRKFMFFKKILPIVNALPIYFPWSPSIFPPQIMGRNRIKLNEKKNPNRIKLLNYLIQYTCMYVYISICMCVGISHDHFT